MGNQPSKPDDDGKEAPSTPRLENSDLITLHKPQPNVSNLIDVVAVHGLDGDALASWTAISPNGTSTMWLRSLLPKHLPNAHTMTFQYNANTIGNMSAHGVRENARELLRKLLDKREDENAQGRSIVFVGHSLGGIVVKQAMKLARDDPRMGDIFHSTKGLVFFGTPHRGTPETKWLTVLSDIACAIRHQPPSAFLKLLETNSSALLKVSEDFEPLAPKFFIVSYYEENVHRKLKTLLVPKMSAVMGLPRDNEDAALMGGDHITMCKFEENDRRFGDVWRSIRRAAAGRQASLR